MVKRKPLKNPPFTPFTRLQPQASHHNQNIQKQSWDVHFRAQSRKKTLIIHIYEEHTHSHWPEATCVNTNLTISSVKIELNNLNNKSEHVLIVGFLCEVFLKQMSLSKNGCPKNRLPMATLYIKHHFLFFFGVPHFRNTQMILKWWIESLAGCCGAEHGDAQNR